jgi:S-DNA-T family DNA segregation ATPase FtsK/SpoIIIE
MDSTSLDASEVRAVAGDISGAIRADVTVVDEAFELDNGKVVDLYIEFENPNPKPVYLTRLLPEVQKDEHGDSNPLPTSTALLGLTDDGTPLLARLAAKSVAHMLVTGQEDAGKSVLLRAIALSLAQTHEPEELRLICVHPDGKTFAPFEGLPHLIRPPVQDVAEGVEAISSLTMMLDYRERYEENAPRVVLLIDDVGELLINGVTDVTTERLQSLIERGREAGIHVVVAAAHPADSSLHRLMLTSFPLRIIGKAANSADARWQSPRIYKRSKDLAGRGDFFADGGGESGPLRFQAAYVGEMEIRNAVRKVSVQVPAYG